MQNHLASDARTIIGRALVIVLAVTVVMLAVSAWAYSQISHAGRSTLFILLLVPAASVLASVLLMAFPFLNPTRESMLRSPDAYVGVTTGVILLGAGAHIILVLLLLGYRVNPAAGMTALMGVLNIVIGSYLSRMHPGFLLGIRTPWTFASDLSWNKTHRLGGRLLVLLGILYVATALIGLRPDWLYLALIMTGMLGAAVFLTVYSYHVWRADPDRRPARWFLIPPGEDRGAD